MNPNKFLLQCVLKSFTFVLIFGLRDTINVTIWEYLPENISSLKKYWVSFLIQLLILVLVVSAIMFSGHDDDLVPM